MDFLGAFYGDRKRFSPTPHPRGLGSSPQAEEQEYDTFPFLKDYDVSHADYPRGGRVLLAIRGDCRTLP
jgi:hypothetical protein